MADWPIRDRCWRSIRRSKIRRTRASAWAVCQIFTLKALPLTPNGKIDRQALPAPSIAANFTDTLVGSRTPGEEILAGIWSQLLNLKKVGIHDNFFDLGGHSLLIAQLLAKVRESFQVELPLRVLFEAPTVAG